MYSRRWSERVPHLGDSYSLLRPVIMVYEPPMQPRTPTMTCTGIGPRHSTTAGRECMTYTECMGGYIQLRGVASQTLVCTLLNARASLFHHAAPGQTSGTVPALIKAAKIGNGLNCERPPFLGASCSSIRKTILRLNPPLLLHVTAGCELRRVLQPGNALKTAHIPRRLLLEPTQFSVSPCAGLSVSIHHAPLPGPALVGSPATPKQWMHHAGRCGSTKKHMHANNDADLPGCSHSHCAHRA